VGTDRDGIDRQMASQEYVPLKDFEEMHRLYEEMYRSYKETYRSYKEMYRLYKKTGRIADEALATAEKLDKQNDEFNKIGFQYGYVAALGDYEVDAPREDLMARIEEAYKEHKRFLDELGKLGPKKLLRLLETYGPDIEKESDRVRRETREMK
jgi:uncharacterized protein Yka (UPF0111/DUF47 family)